MNLSNPAPQPLPPMFPQPVGSVYNLNSANEVGNVPTGPSVSVGLCLNENALYIKTLQNGQPALLGYRLVPMGGSGTTQSNSAPTNYDEVINKLNERISKLENTATIATMEDVMLTWDVKDTVEKEDFLIILKE